MSYRIIGFTIGLLLVILGLTEFIPAITDYTYGEDNAGDFFINALFCLFLGGLLVTVNYGFSPVLTVKQTFLLTTLSWTILSLFAAFPLYMSNLHLSFTDAVFEALSGITTTGSTVLSGLDDMTHGVLLWRSITQWIGGIGIIAFAIVLLPFLKIGGMELFRSESSDASEKVMPRSRSIIASLVLVYVGITLLCFFTYHLLGMSWFDAFNHALTTIPTGGYSTHDASFGYFQSSSLQLAGAFFMLLGGIPFILFVKMLFRGKFVFWQDDQVRALTWMLLVFIGSMSLWLVLHSDYSLWQSFVYVAFNTISVITTTGYATTDYTLWGPFAVMFFFFLTYLGAGAGSTAGGLKTMRLVIVFKAAQNHLKKLIYPHGVFITCYQGKNVSSHEISTVFGFLGVYIVTNVILACALAATGLDLTTAITGAATAVANVGPGMGDIIGPSGNFATFSDTAKWLFCAGMLLGRLEILTVLVVFTPQYWKK